VSSTTFAGLQPRRVFSVFIALTLLGALSYAVPLLLSLSRQKLAERGTPQPTKSETWIALASAAMADLDTARPRVLLLNRIAICPASLAPNVVVTECDRFAEVVFSSRAQSIDIDMRRALIEYSTVELMDTPRRPPPNWPMTLDRHPFQGAEALRHGPEEVDVVSFSNGVVSSDGSVAVILGEVDEWSGVTRTTLYEFERDDQDWRITREVELQYIVP
jgi:hypothetical protein